MFLYLVQQIVRWNYFSSRDSCVETVSNLKNDTANIIGWAVQLRQLDQRFGRDPDGCGQLQLLLDFVGRDEIPEPIRPEDNTLVDFSELDSFATWLGDDSLV